MGKDSRIGWPDDTVNGWWGCAKVSPACTFCYAEGFAKRTGADVWGPSAPRRLRVDAAIRELRAIADRSDREGRPRRVFMHSMSDIFEDRHDLLDPRAREFEALHEINRDRVRIIPMLLTKRAAFAVMEVRRLGLPRGAWVGCTVENQAAADERTPYLLRIPAAVRFLSVEPMLGAMDLDKLWCHNCETDEHVRFDAPGQPWCIECDSEVGPAGWLDGLADERQCGINWVIAGCESSGPRPGKRATDIDWIRSLRDQSVRAGVPFFLKQMSMGGRLVHAPELDGRTWEEVPNV